MKVKTNSRFGRTIIDSKRDLKVHIKPEDIKGAVCSDHQKCVVAKALMRQTGAPWVDVGAHVVVVGKSNERGHRFVLNALAKEQVAYFDTNNGVFAPCMVRMYAPTASIKLGKRTGIHARSGDSSKYKKKKRRPSTR